MAISRFFCSEITDRSFIEGSEAHHLCKVMRLKEGDRVELFDGRGVLAEAAIFKAGRNIVELEVDKVYTSPSRKDCRIVLVVAVAKDHRFDWLIAKATELGVDHICPALYKRSVKQASGKNISERFRNIAISAAKQCKGLFIPKIDAAKTLEQHIGELGRLYNDPVFITSSLGQDSVGILNSPALITKSDKIAFIGPEGGFDEQEEKFLKQQGAIEVRLTDTVLRVETAAIAIASILAASRDNPKL